LILVRAAAIRAPTARVTSRAINITIHEMGAAGYTEKLKGIGSKQKVADNEVLVSFGMGSLSKRRSFPRKRESSPSTGHFRKFAE
jgi:hypothetical protein